MPGQCRVHAHDRRGAPGGRGVPPGRRRVPRPIAVPPRLTRRLSGAAQRRPSRQRHHRQRSRKRAGGRQGGLPPRARPDPLLPGRGTGAGQRSHLPARRPRRAGRRDVAARPAGHQAGRRLRWRWSRHRAPSVRRHPCGPGSGPPRPPPRLDRPGPRAAVDQSDPVPRRHGTPAHRPAAVRGEHGIGGLGRARRAHPGGASRGQLGRQLQPGRGLQGHVGADRDRAPSGGRETGEPVAAHRGPDRPATRPRPAAPASAQQQQQQQVGKGAAPTRGERC